MDVFFTKVDELLEKHNSISRKELDCEPIYHKKFLKSKIRSYSDEATDFHDKHIPKVGSNFTCLAIILIDFVLKKDENYYLEVFFRKT